MKKASDIHLVNIIILLLLSILNIFVFKTTNLYIFSLVLFVASLVSFFFCGYEKNTYRDKKNVAMIIMINIILYFIVTYLLGIFVGFLRSPYSLYIVNILKNIFPFIIIIVLREFFRYLYFTKVNKRKVLVSLGFLFFVLLDVNINIGLYNVFTFSGLIKMICFIIIPSISKNILLIYITTKFGYENPILYSLIMELYQFLVPIYPDFGDYINIIINVTFNIFLIFNISESLFKKRKIVTSRYYKRNLSFYAVITFLLLGMVLVTSGYFRYYAIAIGSGSMTPKIYKGDVVIVKVLKKNEIEHIKKGEIIAYHHDNIIVVHRLVDTVFLNDKEYFITKGDYNLTKDGYYIDKKDVIGTVSFRVRFIGYPTVTLNERLKQNE